MGNCWSTVLRFPFPLESPQLPWQCLIHKTLKQGWVSKGAKEEMYTATGFLENICYSLVIWLGWLYHRDAVLRCFGLLYSSPIFSHHTMFGVRKNLLKCWHKTLWSRKASIGCINIPSIVHAGLEQPNPLELCSKLSLQYLPNGAMHLFSIVGTW